MLSTRPSPLVTVLTPPMMQRWANVAASPGRPAAWLRMAYSSWLGPYIPTDLMISIIVSASIRSSVSVLGLPICRSDRTFASSPGQQVAMIRKSAFTFASKLSEASKGCRANVRVIHDHRPWLQAAKVVGNLLAIFIDQEQCFPL